MSIIQQEDKQEQMDVFRVPLDKLAAMCRRPETLATVVSIAKNVGYKAGQEQAHKYYRMMFAGYDEITITN